MAQYRVMQRSFINNAIAEEGDIVDYDGAVADNLEPIKPGKSAKSPEPAAPVDGAA